MSEPAHAAPEPLEQPVEQQVVTTPPVPDLPPITADPAPDSTPAAVTDPNRLPVVEVKEIDEREFDADGNVTGGKVRQVVYVDGQEYRPQPVANPHPDPTAVWPS